MYRTLNPGNRVRLSGAVRRTGRSDVVQRKGARLLPGRLGFESLRRSRGLVAQRESTCLASRRVSVRVRPGPPSLRSSEEERRRAKPEVAGSTPAGGTSYNQLV